VPVAVAPARQCDGSACDHPTVTGHGDDTHTLRTEVDAQPHLVIYVHCASLCGLDDRRWIVEQ